MILGGLRRETRQAGVSRQKAGTRWRGSVLIICAIASAACNTEPPDYSLTPVLFVHGHGMDSSTWQKIIAHLISLGYPPEYLEALDIVPNTTANVQAATTVIVPAVESLITTAESAAHNGGRQGQVPQRVDIVSHSMGAVSSRWYTAKLRPDRVRTWISLGGANHGSNTLCNFGDEAAREMCPAFATNSNENAVQVGLNGTRDAPRDETPYGLGVDRAETTRIPPDDTRSILYLTVRIEPDFWIKPEGSATLDGSGGVPLSVPPQLGVEETNAGNYLFPSDDNFFRLFRRNVDHGSLPEHPDLVRLLAVMLTSRKTE